MTGGRRTMALPLPPVSIDLQSNGTQSEQEQRLLRYLDDLEAEAQRAKKRWVKPEDTERDLKLYRGEFGPDTREPYFECNFIQKFIDRELGMLTENRPIIRVEEGKAGLKQFCQSLERGVESCWEQQNMQRQTWKVMHNAAVN